MTTAYPDLSIVIVSYQCKRSLLDLLDDLAAARDDVSLDVHVVDNASEDGTPAAVLAAHPWVAMTALSENVGFGRANKRGDRSRPFGHGFAAQPRHPGHGSRASRLRG